MGSRSAEKIIGMFQQKTSSPSFCETFPFLGQRKQSLKTFWQHGERTDFYEMCMRNLGSRHRRDLNLYLI